MFKQKYEKQILAFLPCGEQNGSQKSGHEQKSHEDVYNYNQNESSQQCFTPNYNQVQQQPLTQYAQERQYEQKDDEDHNKNEVQNKIINHRNQHKESNESQNQNEKNESLINYSLYQKLRDGNAIQYADIIYANCKPEQQNNSFRQYRDSGINFLEDELMKINGQSIILPQVYQNDLDPSHVNKGKNLIPKNNKTLVNSQLEPIYESFYISAECAKPEEDFLNDWNLIVEFLKYQYLQTDCNFINLQNQKKSKISKEPQVENYRGSWPGKNLQIQTFKKIENISKKSNIITKPQIPIQILHQTQKIQQKIQPFRTIQKSNKKTLQNQIQIIMQKLAKNQNLNLERIKKEDKIVQKYKDFLLKVKNNHQKSIQKSIIEQKTTTGKRIQKASTDILKTQRVIKKQIRSTYDQYLTEIKSMKKQFQVKTQKHEQQLNQIQENFQNQFLIAFESLKQVKKQIVQKRDLLQEQIQHTFQRLNKALQTQIIQNQDMTEKIRTVMIQIMKGIEQSQ